LSKRSTIGEGEYKIEDFNFLIGREHVDPDNGLVYTTIGIRKHGRFIAADRRLSAAPMGKVEAIHALDVVGYAKPAPACSSSAAVRISATMGKAKPSPSVSHPVAAVRVSACKPRPGDSSYPVTAQTTPGTPKISPSSEAKRFGTPREAPGSPVIIYTADSGPPWSPSRNIPPRLSDKRDSYYPLLQKRSISRRLSAPKVHSENIFLPTRVRTYLLLILV